MSNDNVSKTIQIQVTHTDSDRLAEREAFMLTLAKCLDLRTDVGKGALRDAVADALAILGDRIQDAPKGRVSESAMRCEAYASHLLTLQTAMAGKPIRFRTYTVSDLAGLTDTSVATVSADLAKDARFVQVFMLDGSQIGRGSAYDKAGKLNKGVTVRYSFTPHE